MAGLFDDIPTVAPQPKAKAPAPRAGLFDDIPDQGVGDLLMTGLKKLPSSAGALIKNTVNSLNPANYPAEGRAISSLVRGGLENVRDMSPPENRGDAPPMATPQERTAATAAGHAVVRPFTHPLKAFAEDPASALSTWSIPLTLGGSSLEAAPVGALQTAGKVMTTAGDLTNPVGAALKVAGAVPKVVGKVLPKGVPAAEMAARRARFAAAGVDPSYATIGGPLTQAGAEFTAKGPLSFGARANLAKQVAQTGEAVADTAGSYGNATTPALAGETIQGGIKRYVGDAATPGSFKAKVEGLYDNAFTPILKGETDAIAKSEAAQAQKAGNAAGDYEKQLADAQAAQRGEQMAAEQGMPIPDDQKTVLPVKPEPPAATPTTSTAKTQETLSDIASTINSPSIRGVIQDQRIPKLLDAIQQDPASVRFTDLRSLRTWVRNAQGNPDLILGVGQGNLQKLEGALTDDIYANAQQFGGDAALQKLKRTDEFYRKGTQRIQTALQPFVDKASGEGAFARLQAVAGSGSTADVNSLFRLKRSLQPDEWGDVQASLIQNAGMAPSEGATTFSPTKFVDWYSKLPEQSKAVLFGGAGSAAKAKDGAAALRAQLDNLVSVSNDVSKVEKTSQAVKGASAWQTGALGLTALGAATTLHPGVILSEIGALGGEATAAQILTSPKALRWITRVSAASAKGGEAMQPVLNGLARVAKTDAQLQPVYQAVQSVMKPPEKPAEGSQGFDPSTMTDDELKATAGAAAPAETPSAAPSGDREAMINGMQPEEALALTMAGEGSSDPHEMAGVGHVVMNRLNSGKFGSTLSDVLKPEEFNAWENPEKLAALKDTPKYQQALALAHQIASGQHADITGNARHFYAPEAQAELHRTNPTKYPHLRPDFAQGDGLPLGKTVFYP